MKKSEVEKGETTFSLLGRKSKTQQSSSTSRIKRCICVTVIVCLIILFILGVLVFISFSKYTKSLRCKASDSFDLELVECAPAATLASLSEVSHPIQYYLNDTSLHHGNENNTICGNATRHGNGSTECGQDLDLRKKQELEWRILGEKTWNIAYEILTDKGGWYLDKGSSFKTGRIYSKTFEDIGRVSRLEVHFETTEQQLKDLLLGGFVDLPKWNPTMGKVELLETVGDNIQIVHMMMNSFVEGLMSGRDFVSIRYWKTVNNVTLAAQTATEHPDSPPGDDYVRGYHKPGGMMFSPVKNKPNKMLFKWSMAADMGMWMPQFLVDRTKAMAMSKFTENMKEKLKELNSQ